MVRRPSPVKVFLVDDHSLVRDGLRLRLETAADLRVIGEAANADDALTALQALDAANAALPDLILLDLYMRGASGLDLAGVLHDRYPQIAVLILSMHDNVEYMLQAVRAGARGYLLKDDPSHEIIQAIDAVMNGRSYFSTTASLKLSQASAPAALLTLREREILRHIAEGHSNKQMAQALNLSVRTIETHRLNIKRKLAIEGQAELIKYAVEHRTL